MLVDFDASRVKAHHKVKAFYGGLEVRTNLQIFRIFWRSIFRIAPLVRSLRFVCGILSWSCLPVVRKQWHNQ